MSSMGFEPSTEDLLRAEVRGLEDRVAALEHGMSVSEWLEYESDQRVARAIATGNIGWAMGYLACRNIDVGAPKENSGL